LKWNDFENNISSAFKELRSECDLFDCTLSAGGRKIQAHKLILSACSKFFRNVFKENVHQHPLIYLRGVNSSDLLSALDFMYHGEVRVCQTDLNTFLALAEDLEIKGLTQTNGSHSQSHTRRVPPDPSPSKGMGMRLPLTGQQPEDLLEIKSEASDNGSNGPLPFAIKNDSYVREYEEREINYDRKETDDSNYQQLDPSQDVVRSHSTALGGGKYSCNLCQITARDKYNMRRHLETTHDLSTGYQCELCRKQFKAKHQLTVHKARGCGVSLPPF